MISNELKTPAGLSEKITDFYLGIMLSGYLLFTGFKGYSGITEQKTVFFYSVTIAYLAVCLIFPIYFAIKKNIILQSPWAVINRLNYVHKFMLLYLLMTAISAFLSEYKENAFLGGARCEGFITIALYVLSFIFVSVNYKPKLWNIYVFGIGSSINALIAIIQIFGKNPLLLFPGGMNYYDAGKLYSGEFLGTIGNVDLLGAVFALTISIFFSLLLFFKRKQKLLALIPLSLCTFVLIKSSVAGGILGALGGTVISFPALCKNSKIKKILFISLLIIILLGLLIIFFFGDRFSGSIFEVYEIMHGNFDDSFGTGRIYIWKNVIKLFPKKPLFGGGPETLVLRTDAYFERYDENLNVLIHSSIDTAHNEYLNILINQGMLALLFYCSALTVIIIEYVKKAYASPELALCGTGCIAYMISAFFGISVPISAPFFWISLAISASEI